MRSLESAEEIYAWRQAELEALDKNSAIVGKHLKRERYWKIGKYGMALTPMIAAGIFGETHWAHEISRAQRIDSDIIASGLGSIAMYQIGEWAQKRHSYRARHISATSAKLSEDLGVALPHTIQQVLESE